MCIAHTAAGEFILRHELKFTHTHWQWWKEFLQLYLAMEVWFHDSNPKDEVRHARPAISSVLTSLQLYFPRQADSNQYNLPKMHGMAKMQDYVCLFGSAINFYGGPGEASHKSFVKAPGLKTQRRMCEFAKQTAGQYYNIMMVNKATTCIGQRRICRDDSDDSIQNAEGDDSGEHYRMQGEYSMELPSDNCDEIKLKSSNKNLTQYGMHEDFIRVLRRIHSAKDGPGHRNNAMKHQIVGYTRASIIDSQGEEIHFSAHPNYHGGQWYDWAYVYFEVDDENGKSRAQYYPSKILGFIRVEGEVEAVVQCSVDSLEWARVEEEFVVHFRLCNNFERSYVTVPISALTHPLCVVPDYGGDDEYGYMVVLPRRNWSQYFSSFIEAFHDS